MHLILFDCDGTLVDSQHMIVAAMSRGFSDHGLEPPPRETILSIVGLSLPLAVERLLSHSDKSTAEAVANSYRQAFFDLRRDTDWHEPLYDGAHGTIEALRARDDVMLGIATGKSRRGVDAILAGHGMEGWFTTIQTADNNPSKPHPGMIETALSETGVEQTRCVIVGDTSFDMEMGRSAGIAGVGVAWGYHPVDDLHRSGAACVLDHFGELPAALDRIFGWRGESS